MKVNKAIDIITQHYTDDYDWIVAWCKEFAKDVPTEDDENTILTWYNEEFEDYILDNILENYPFADKYDIVTYYSYRWDRNNTVVDNLYEFGEWWDYNNEINNLPSQTGEALL